MIAETVYLLYMGLLPLLAVYFDSIPYHSIQSAPPLSLFLPPVLPPCLPPSLPLGVALVRTCTLEHAPNTTGTVETVFKALERADDTPVFQNANTMCAFVWQFFFVASVVSTRIYQLEDFRFIAVHPPRDFSYSWLL
jgi:hypothetical protein